MSTGNRALLAIGITLLARDFPWHFCLTNMCCYFKTEYMSNKAEWACEWRQASCSSRDSVPCLLHASHSRFHKKWKHYYEFYQELFFSLKVVILLSINIKIKIKYLNLCSSLCPPLFSSYLLPSSSHYTSLLYHHLSFWRIYIVTFGKELRRATVYSFTNSTILIIK